MKEKEIVFHFSNFLIFTQNHLLTIRNTPHTQNSTKRFYSVYRRPSKEKARKEKKKKIENLVGRDWVPLVPMVIYVFFWYRYSVAGQHHRCTSQSIAVRHDKPVGHKTEISQSPKYNAAINRNRNSPLPFNRNAKRKKGRKKKWIDQKQSRFFAGRDEHALFGVKSSRSISTSYVQRWNAPLVIQL